MWQTSVLATLVSVLLWSAVVCMCKKQKVRRDISLKTESGSVGIDQTQDDSGDKPTEPAPSPTEPPKRKARMLQYAKTRGSVAVENVEPTVSVEQTEETFPKTSLLTRKADDEWFTREVTEAGADDTLVNIRSLRTIEAEGATE
jgi:hypothetical protein